MLLNVAAGNARRWLEPVEWWLRQLPTRAASHARLYVERYSGRRRRQQREKESRLADLWTDEGGQERSQDGPFTRHLRRVWKP